MISRVILLALAVTSTWAQSSYVVPSNGTVRFQSPNYPNMYSNNQRRFYNFEGPAGYALQFDSIFFDTEYGGDKLTFSEIINGKYVELGIFSGSKRPRQLLSSSASVTALFETDSSHTGRGFLIDAWSCASVACPVQHGLVTVPAVEKVMFQSPGYPNGYATHTHLVYQLSGPAGYGIQFDTEGFSTLSGYDSLEFSEIVGNQYVELGTFRGRTGPQGLRSRSNSVTAVFSSYATIHSGDGFRIVAQAVTPRRM